LNTAVPFGITVSPRPRPSHWKPFNATHSLSLTHLQSACLTRSHLASSSSPASLHEKVVGNWSVWWFYITIRYQQWHGDKSISEISLTNKSKTQFTIHSKMSSTDRLTGNPALYWQ